MIRNSTTITNEKPVICKGFMLFKDDKGNLIQLCPDTVQNLRDYFAHENDLQPLGAESFHVDGKRIMLGRKTEGGLLEVLR